MKKTFYSIQYLRFIAATMVVVLHASHSYNVHLGANPDGVFHMGETGVDIFFVISGFIMFVLLQNTNRSGAEFFWLRLTRVAPPYWVVTFVVVLAASLRPELFYATELSPSAVLASLFFLPWQNPAGHVQPILYVGWTLNVELLFYSLISLSLLIPLSRMKRCLLAGGALLGLGGLGLWLRPEAAVAEVWSSPLLIEFAFGLIVGWLYFSSWKLPWPLALVFIGAGCFALAQVHGLGGTGDPTRWFIAGLPAALIVWSVLELEKHNLIPEINWLRFLGDVSFALYLCHYFAIGILRVVWPKSMIGGLTNDISFYLAALALSFAGSIVFYLLIEKPLVFQAQRAVKARFRRPTQTASTPPSSSSRA